MPVWALGIHCLRGHEQYNVEVIGNVRYWSIGLKWYPLAVGFL